MTALERATTLLERNGWQDITVDIPYPDTCPKMRSITAKNGHTAPLLRMSVHVIVWEPKRKGQKGKLAHVRFSGFGSEDRQPKRWQMFDIWAGVLARRSQ